MNREFRASLDYLLRPLKQRLPTHKCVHFIPQTHLFFFPFKKVYWNVSENCTVKSKILPIFGLLKGIIYISII